MVHAFGDEKTMGLAVVGTVAGDDVLGAGMAGENEVGLLETREIVPLPTMGANVLEIFALAVVVLSGELVIGTMLFELAELEVVGANVEPLADKGAGVLGTIAQTSLRPPTTHVAFPSR
jgi:hypothetical protein